MFQLVDSGWEQVFQKAASANSEELLIICPFIKAGPMSRLLDHAECSSIRVLTRLSERDLFDRVSDIAALELLLERKATIRGIKNLHAKLFVFGTASVVAGSANLTEAAWRRNLEFGFTSGQPDVIQGCRDYFESLWNRTTGELTWETLKSIRSSVERARKSVGSSQGNDFKDHGQDLGTFGEPTAFEALPAQAFVKFFGQGNERSDWDTPVLEEADGSGCHYACTYPKGKRPRRVRDGDTVFMGRFVHNPHDLVIYGRAIAQAHVEGRDDASPAEIEKRDWKAQWPHYIRVHSAQFVAGTLRNGVSLNQLIDSLGTQAFRASAERAEKSSKPVNPRNSLKQQPQVELTAEGWAWVTERLQHSFAKHGMLGDEELSRLDWPPGARIGEVA